MTGHVIALVAGTVLAVGALAYVLYPLFFDTATPPAPSPRNHARDDSAIRALREIEFDRATGKLSDSDYSELRKSYGERALRELRDADTSAAPPLADSDAIEARVHAYRLAHRACETCGFRPEPDAIYCSTCGGYLARTCPACSGTVTETSAAFCSTCGQSIAAFGRIRLPTVNH